jgi:Flp pilus assembly pilin Flp
MLKRKTRAQSVLEYAILMVIVIAALISIQTYVKRGLQGRLTSATDDIGDQVGVGGKSNVYKRVDSYSKTQENALKGEQKSSTVAEGSTNTTKNVTVDTNGAVEWLL